MPQGRALTMRGQEEENLRQIQQPVAAFRTPGTELVLPYHLVLLNDLLIEMAPLKMDLTLIQWMLGLLLGGVVALLLKAFSPF